MNAELSHARIDRVALDALNPFFVWVDTRGAIVAHGRTISKLFGNSDLTGQPSSAHFVFIRPYVGDVAQIVDHAVSLRVRTRPPRGVAAANLPGTAIRLADGGGHLLMLTPGLELQRLAEIFDLRKSDLSAADGSEDLMFLLQSQRHLMQEMLDTATLVEEGRRAAEAEAKSDLLTGLLNRRGLTENLESLLAGGARGNCGLVHLDLDRFKMINDTHGHAAGDAVLVHVGAVLKSAVRPPFFAGRLGGDEFVAVLPGLEQPEALIPLAETLAGQIASPVTWGEFNLKIGATYGLTWVPAGSSLSFDDILHQADLALLDGKRRGRARITVYDGVVMHQQQRLRAIASELPEALARGEFVPAYHPQIEIAGGRLAGVEVLARWNHPDRGLLAPEDFLESAEYSNIMNDIDASLRNQALADLATWRRAGLDVPKISFNMSDGVLASESLAGDLVWQADAHGVPVGDIKLEVLESIFMDRAGIELKERAAELNRIGFRLALDDFGTGHASLSSLISLPIREIKIDRSFAHGVAGDPRLQTLSESVCRLAERLGLEVVAEGVEQPEDLDCLKGFGVRIVQGFLYARPMLAADLADWIVRRPDRAQGRADRPPERLRG
jgi:diguanylate cyclase (GGDEF)-like protein